MKTYPTLLCLILTLSNCSNTKSNQQQVSADSVHHIVDTLRMHNEVPIASSSAIADNEPFSGRTMNFPEFVIDTPAIDSLETAINNRMSEVLQAYDTIEYLRISSSYSWTQPITSQGQEGETFIVDETKEETSIWLFDRSFRLRCFTKEVKYDDDYGSGTESIIYLFSNDSLIAVSERKVDSYEVEEIKVARMLASEFPLRGFLRQAQYENVNISYLMQENLASREEDFFESLSELLATLKTGRKNAAEDDFYFQFEVNRTQEANPDKKAEAVIYPVTFMVGKALYPNYISRQ